MGQANGFQQHRAGQRDVYRSWGGFGADRPPGRGALLGAESSHRALQHGLQKETEQRKNILSRDFSFHRLVSPERHSANKPSVYSSCCLWFSKAFWLLVQKAEPDGLVHSLLPCQLRALLPEEHVCPVLVGGGERAHLSPGRSSGTFCS